MIGRLPSGPTCDQSALSDGRPPQTMTRCREQAPRTATLTPKTLDDGDEQQPAERDRDQELPAEVHQLVVAQPRQRRTDPDLDEQEDERLSEEPEDRPEPAQDITCDAGPSGPPKNSVTTTADIVIVFMNSARKNSAKRIDEYSVWKPPTELLLAFGEVERRPVQLRGDRDEEDHERHDAEAEHVPVPEMRRPGCRRSSCVDSEPTVTAVPVTRITVTIVRPSAAS